MSDIDNSHSRAEYVRIGWRNWVLSFPHGVLLLSSLVRRGFKERDLAPDRVKFDPMLRMVSDSV